MQRLNCNSIGLELNFRERSSARLRRVFNNRNACFFLIQNAKSPLQEYDYFFCPVPYFIDFLKKHRQSRNAAFGFVLIKILHEGCLKGCQRHLIYSDCPHKRVFRYLFNDLSLAHDDPTLWATKKLVTTKGNYI